MIGIILDSVLMLLLVAALAYGVRLEKKLTALRAGQLAFADAVNELNGAAGRAQAALSDLRAAGEDADLLHDRIVKARTLKTELETLMSRMERAGRPLTAPPIDALTGDEIQTREDTSRAGRAGRTPPALAEITGRRRVAAEAVSTRVSAEQPTAEDERARRMQALADRIQGMAGQVSGKPGISPARTQAPGRESVEAIVGALSVARVSANQTPQDRINRARRSLDEDLFAA